MKINEKMSENVALVAIKGKNNIKLNGNYTYENIQQLLKVIFLLLL